MIYVSDVQDDISGGYAIDIKHEKGGKEKTTLVLNSRKNAEAIKRILEIDNTKEKMGYWYKLDGFPRHHFCSGCGRGNRSKSDFCPRCGIPMEEKSLYDEQVSEPEDDLI